MDTLGGPQEQENISLEDAVFFNIDQDWAEPLIISSESGRTSLEFFSQNDIITEFLKALSTAHQCLPEIQDGSQEIKYSGPSPDEIALVEQA